MKNYLLIILILILSGCTTMYESKTGDVVSAKKISFEPNIQLISSLTGAYSDIKGCGQLEDELKECNIKIEEQEQEMQEILDQQCNEDPVYPVEGPTIVNIPEPTASNCPENGDGSKECPFTNTRFSHTQYDPNHEKDGGKSLVTCPDQGKAYSSCRVGMVPIGWHRIVENGRGSYWNMKNAPKGDIICKDFDGKYHLFPSPEDEVIHKSKWKLDGHKCKP